MSRQRIVQQVDNVLDAAARGIAKSLPYGMGGF